MKTQEEIQAYMQLDDWHVTVVSPAEQEITPNRREHCEYDPEHSSVHVFQQNLYFTVSPEDGSAVYEIDGAPFEDADDFLVALEEAFAAADFPSDEAAMHEALQKFEDKHPYSR